MAGENDAPPFTPWGRLLRNPRAQVVGLVALLVGGATVLGVSHLASSSPTPPRAAADLPALPGVEGRRFDGGYSFAPPGRFPDAIDPVSPFGVRVITTTTPGCESCAGSLGAVRSIVVNADPRVTLAHVVVRAVEADGSLSPFPIDDALPTFVERPGGLLGRLPAPTTIVVGADGRTIDWITDVIDEGRTGRRLRDAIETGVAAAPPVEFPAWVRRQLPGLLDRRTEAIRPDGSEDLGDLRYDYTQARRLTGPDEGGLYAVPFAGVRGIAIVDAEFGHARGQTGLPLTSRSPVLAANLGEAGRLTLAGLAREDVASVDALLSGGGVGCSAEVRANVWSCARRGDRAGGVERLRVRMVDGSVRSHPIFN